MTCQILFLKISKSNEVLCRVKSLYMCEYATNINLLFYVGPASIPSHPCTRHLTTGYERQVVQTGGFDIDTFTRTAGLHPA